MILRNHLSFINNLFRSVSFHFRNIYLNSNYYNKKISQTNFDNLIYKPSPHLLSSLINYQAKKINVNEISTDENLWNNKDINSKDFKRLNNFYWFFSLDLKSPKNNTQKIISDWIKKNLNYNSKSWEFDLTSKRIIAWLSNHSLTFEGSSKNYQNKFNRMVLKQTNHLMNEINKSKFVDDKVIGCAAIILVGLCYKNENNLSYGLNLLKKISKFSFDNYGFPRSRNIKQLVFYLKYFILIREWFKEAQVETPEYINETIYYLGQGYAFIWQNIECDILMNGNNISNNSEFDHYLKRSGYKFKNENKEFGGYAILYDKKISLVMDVGPSPSSKFSTNYQSGALSFEIISNGKKLITNCGFHSNNTKLAELSRSTATHSTLVVDDNSSCHYKKINNKKYFIRDALRILKKNIIFEKNYWKISAAHDGYQKQYNAIHEREIEFYPKQDKFVGTDKVLNKKNSRNLKFEIRFHFEPEIKLMKTQDNKTILIKLEDEGWKFTCDKYDINIDNGLYFGNENYYIQNQNIFISGITNDKNENISWQLNKI